MTDRPGAGTLQRRVRGGAGPIVTKLWDIDVVGYDRLPTEGPAILCPNHISFLDSAFLVFTLPRNISFVGKAEYMDSWKTKFLFPAMGMIPIDRSGGEKSAAALDAAKQVLDRGELFGIFPEGTRSRSGKLHKGRTGAARLAMELDVPIFPVGITGTDQIQPPDAKVPKLRKSCSIEIGRAVKPARYRNRGSDHLAWRSMTDEVMFEIGQMTGQEYVHRYAGESESEPVVTGRVASVSELLADDTPTGETHRELAVAAGT
ncbi:MAG: lysophospholipid acyltransferase family protein [Actinomycetota bacterium]